MGFFTEADMEVMVRAERWVRKVEMRLTPAQRQEGLALQKEYWRLGLFQKIPPFDRHDPRSSNPIFESVVTSCVMAVS
jgi:hypothetical protein